ncbi:MAG TPA: hypothetical protein VK325_06130 [Pseudoxanthomonas sp.]|nr:hypothetical protein [Pseudoxanthomonas sp.]
MEEAAGLLLAASRREPLPGILGYETRLLVSIDFLANPRSSIVDTLSTRVIDGTQVKIYAWYDNEWDYGKRSADSRSRSAAPGAPKMRALSPSVRQYALVTGTTGPSPSPMVPTDAGGAAFHQHWSMPSASAGYGAVRLAVPTRWPAGLSLGVGRPCRRHRACLTSIAAVRRAHDLTSGGIQNSRRDAEHPSPTQS